MTTTPRLGVNEWAAAQATPNLAVNEAVRTIEQGANAFIGKDKDLATPPGSPVDGDCYIVAAAATGDWTGHSGKLAIYNSGWLFITPLEGMACYLQDENLLYRYDGAAWTALLAPGTVEVLDEGASAEPVAAAFNFTGSGVTVTADGLGGVDIDIPGGAGGSIEVLDEGVTEEAAATALNFTGAGVTVTADGLGGVDIDIPGGGGGGGAWTLVSTTVIASAVSSVDVTGLAGANDIMIAIRGVTSTASASRGIRLSVDNGATYYSTSGDYHNIGSTGAESNVTALSMASGTVATGVTGFTIIHAAGLSGVPKYAAPMFGNVQGVFDGSTLPVDAVQLVAPFTTLTGGTVYVFTR